MRPISSFQTPAMPPVRFGGKTPAKTPEATPEKKSGRFTGPLKDRSLSDAWMNLKDTTSKGIRRSLLGAAGIGIALAGFGANVSTDVARHVDQLAVHWDAADAAPSLNKAEDTLQLLNEYPQPGVLGPLSDAYFAQMNTALLEYFDSTAAAQSLDALPQFQEMKPAQKQLTRDIMAEASQIDAKEAGSAKAFGELFGRWVDEVGVPSGSVLPEHADHLKEYANRMLSEHQSYEARQDKLLTIGDYSERGGELGMLLFLIAGVMLVPTFVRGMKDIAAVGDELNEAVGDKVIDLFDGKN